MTFIDCCIAPPASHEIVIISAIQDEPGLCCATVRVTAVWFIFGAVFDRPGRITACGGTLYIEQLGWGNTYSALVRRM